MKNLDNCFAKLNVEKMLRIGAAAIFVIQLINLLTSLYHQLVQPSYTPAADMLMVVVFSLLSHATLLVFQPLVLLGLAELIRLKKETKLC